MTETTRYPEVTTTRWSSGSDTDLFTVQNPATGEPVTLVQGSGTAEVDRAVRTAHLCWKQRPARERGGYLRRIADTLRTHADELAALETLEMGKPLATSRGFDLEAAITEFEYFAGMVEVLPSQARDFGPFLDVTTLEPYGVIGGIVPFNWPPIHTAGKIAPALAVGNAIVVKPPEQTPSVVLRMVDLIAEVLPDDVVHALPGGGAVGAAIAGHPLVSKVSFTGSPATGAAVMRTAAATLTPSLMELGGKNALLVFDDADFDQALLAALDGGFFNQGEACTASSRLLLHESIHDEFVARLAGAVERLVVGDGVDPATEVGPVVTRAQQERVLDYIQIGLSEGAQIAAQALLPTDPALKGGFYVAPTLLTGVSREMRVATEEIFGPVLTVLKFTDEEEAVQIANGTRCGIGDSGFGREHAPETLAEYGYSKTVRLATRRSELPAWSGAVRTTGVSPTGG